MLFDIPSCTCVCSNPDRSVPRWRGAPGESWRSSADHAAADADLTATGRWSVSDLDLPAGHAADPAATTAGRGPVGASEAAVVEVTAGRDNRHQGAARVARVENEE